MELIIILQAVIAEGGANKLYEYGVLGIVVVGLAFGVWQLVKYIKGVNQAEHDRLVKEKDEAGSKVDVLYSEIKEMQAEHADKLNDLLVETNEIHRQTVIALDKNAEALNNNSVIFNKLLDKLMLK